MAEIFAPNSFYSRSLKKSSKNEFFKVSASKSFSKSRKIEQPVLQASLKTGKKNLKSNHYLKIKKKKNRKQKYKNDKMKKILNSIKPQEIEEKIVKNELVTKISLKTDLNKRFFKKQNGKRKNFTIEQFQPSKSTKMSSEDGKNSSDLTRYKLMSHCLNDSYEDDVEMDDSSSESEEEEEDGGPNIDVEILKKKDDDVVSRLFSEDEEEEEDILKNINNIWNNEDSLSSPIKTPSKKMLQKSNSSQKLFKTPLKQTLISPETTIKQNTKNKCSKENMKSPLRLHQMTLVIYFLYNKFARLFFCC